MRLRLTVLLACLTGMLVSGGPASAVIGGQLDGLHPYVGLVATDIGQVCSGTLVDSTHFVTAAHCFSGDGAPAQVFFGTQVAPTMPFSVGTARVHPGFCPGCQPELGGFATHDLAVVVLTAPVVLSEYGQLPAVGTIDSMRRMGRRTEVTLVGYGVSAFVKVKGVKGKQPVSTFERLAADARIKRMDEKEAEDTHLRLSSRRDGAACFGDSGGPNFLEHTRTIIAINSFGSDDRCRKPAYSYRLDSPEARGFLASLGL